MLIFRPCFPLLRIFSHRQRQTFGMTHVWQHIVLLFCLGITTPASATIIEGIVLDDKGPATASVIAYRSFSELHLKANGIISSKGPKPGQYKLDLAPGKYYLVAQDSNHTPPLFGYHGLNPITIGDCYQWIPFFVLPELPVQCEPGFQGISGAVLYKGAPITHGSVSAYTSDDEPFRGMGVLTNSIGEDGKFWFELPPGSYVIVARQRQDDTAIGPLKQGDLFCYSAANPIKINPANTCEVNLHCYPRDDMDH
ncbi:MAG: carboxypeptidase-like regulatory domain-containing protein, partial [Desulfobulbaceae bacterium]|nr:carboxypeptidase-like regulatory domain-containing protein [Desulfobulbaceae bacterium]